MTGRPVGRPSIVALCHAAPSSPRNPRRLDGADLSSVARCQNKNKRTVRDRNSGGTSDQAKLQESAWILIVGRHPETSPSGIFSGLLSADGELATTHGGIYAGLRQRGGSLIDLRGRCRRHPSSSCLFATGKEKAAGGGGTASGGVLFISLPVIFTEAIRPRAVPISQSGPTSSPLGGSLKILIDRTHGSPPPSSLSLQKSEFKAPPSLCHQ